MEIELIALRAALNAENIVSLSLISLPLIVGQFIMHEQWEHTLVTQLTADRAELMTLEIGRGGTICHIMGDCQRLELAVK